MVDIKTATVEGVIGWIVSKVAEGATLVYPAALAAAGSIFAVVAAFLRDEGVPPIRDHWWIFVICAVAFLLLGIAVGAWIRNRQYEKKLEADRARIDDAIEERTKDLKQKIADLEAEKAERERGEIDKVMSLGCDAARLAVEIDKSGGYVDVSRDGHSHRLSQIYGDVFFSVERYGRFEIRLRPEWVRLVRLYGDKLRVD